MDGGQPTGADPCSWSRVDPHRDIIEPCSRRGAATTSRARGSRHSRGVWETGRRAPGGPVAESAVDPPGPIPNPVVTHRSAGEYLGSDSLGGEAAAGPPGASARTHTALTRGGAVAARWAHNPKAGGSNPSPATMPTTRSRDRERVVGVSAEAGWRTPGAIGNT